MQQFWLLATFWSNVLRQGHSRVPGPHDSYFTTSGWLQLLVCVLFFAGLCPSVLATDAHVLWVAGRLVAWHMWNFTCGALSYELK